MVKTRRQRGGWISGEVENPNRHLLKYDPRTDLAVFRAMKKQYGGMKNRSGFVKRLFNKTNEKQLVARAKRAARPKRQTRPVGTKMKGGSLKQKGGDNLTEKDYIDMLKRHGYWEMQSVLPLHMRRKRKYMKYKGPTAWDRAWNLKHHGSE